MDELLPCPHCGGSFGEDPSLIGRLHDPLKRRGLPFGWMMVCPNLGCGAAMFAATREQLVSQWNARLPYDPDVDPLRRAATLLMFDSVVLAQQFKDMVERAEIVVAPFTPTPEPIE